MGPRNKIVNIYSSLEITDCAPMSFKTGFYAFLQRSKLPQEGGLKLNVPLPFRLDSIHKVKNLSKR